MSLTGFCVWSASVANGGAGVLLAVRSQACELAVAKAAAEMGISGGLAQTGLDGGWLRPGSGFNAAAGAAAIWEAMSECFFFTALPGVGVSFAGSVKTKKALSALQGCVYMGEVVLAPRDGRGMALDGLALAESEWAFAPVAKNWWNEMGPTVEALLADVEKRALSSHLKGQGGKAASAAVSV